MNIDNYKKIIHNNLMFILVYILISVIILNISTRIGFSLLLFLTLLVLLSPILLKYKKEDNYWQIILKLYHQIDDKIQLHLEKQKELRERMEVKKKSEEEKQRLKQEELIKINKKKYEEQIGIELANLKKVLELQGLSENAISIALAERHSIISKKYESTPNKSTVSEGVRFQNHIEIGNSNEPFEVKKHGMVLNIVLYVLGLLPFFVVITAIESLFGISAELFLSIPFLLISIINLIFYLPTFLYHASISGKILVFIFNAIFGVTVIGWIVLMIIVSSKNTEHAYREALLYNIQNKG